MIAQTDNPIAAYKIGAVYCFRVLLLNRLTSEERCELVTLDSDRFCNVVAHVNRCFPGWALLESWEVA